MAIAFESFQALSQQLRFLLFEIGIGLSQSAVDAYISQAHRNALSRLQKAALADGLLGAPILSPHVDDFVNQLQAALQQTDPASRFYHWQALREEMYESIANEAMALAYRRQWQQQLQQRSAKYQSFWHWLCEDNTAHEAWLLLEQWGCIGHPSHPNFRAKMGFSRREVLQYSPEFDARVRLHWGALKRGEEYICNGSDRYETALRQHFPLIYQQWQQQLAFKHYHADEYLPIPVHPWQWRHHQDGLLAPLIDQKKLILIPHLQEMAPSMSFRTMMPLGQQGCQLKLATAIHTTSAKRTVSPSSIYNGPQLSQWLNRILAEENHFQKRLYLLEDLSGMRINSPEIDRKEHKQLAVILRQIPAQLLEDQERIVPLAALFVQSPKSNQALLLEMIAAAKLDPKTYFRHLCRVVLDSQLQLMLKYGIALEAHQQNTLIAFKNHLPTRLLIRDLGNIRICQWPVFHYPGKPDLHPDSTIDTDSLDEVRHKFIHGNLQANLAYWIDLLSQYYATPASDYWQIVRETLVKGFAMIESPLSADLISQQKHALLQEPWARKCLLAMRLNPVQSDYVYQSAPNPLDSNP